ncbi:hypothetical protein FBEOM_14550 [Fusarium beomiforme]|uniref:Uncharacterized protein n=1 Tax=Fusarium beomiforme TaxID=44412 RepID=A0A9P5A549_9HYPO|nr:hypothetical protein FBEOM_14550 [Fusarium beomiforme]
MKVKGLLAIEDDNIIRNTLREAGVSAKGLGLNIVNENEIKIAKDKGQEPVPERYFKFQSIRGGLDYTIISLGHEIGVKTQYETTELKKYEIKIRKGRDFAMKKRIRRGLNQHDLYDLMHDAIRLGIITHAELIGHIVGKTIGGTTMEDMSSKYLEALTGASGSKNLALAADK